MDRDNRFKNLEEADYEKFKNVAPYIYLDNGKWTSLFLNRHPIYYLIRERFSSSYDGKLMWREINYKQEEIEKIKESFLEYRQQNRDEIRELNVLLTEQRNLCGEACLQELQKHLKECSENNGASKCNFIYVGDHCQFKDNGRCSHYYEIERIKEKLEEYESNCYDYENEIMDLKIEYERALAIKEDRLEKTFEDDYDY